MHAWATLFLYELEKHRTGKGDRAFLENAFQKPTCLATSAGGGSTASDQDRIWQQRLPPGRLPRPRQAIGGAFDPQRSRSPPAATSTRRTAPRGWLPTAVNPPWSLTAGRRQLAESRRIPSLEHSRDRRRHEPAARRRQREPLGRGGFSTTVLRLPGRQCFATRLVALARRLDPLAATSPVGGRSAGPALPPESTGRVEHWSSSSATRPREATISSHEAMGPSADGRYLFALVRGPAAPRPCPGLLDGRTSSFGPHGNPLSSPATTAEHPYTSPRCARETWPAAPTLPAESRTPGCSAATPTGLAARWFPVNPAADPRPPQPARLPRRRLHRRVPDRLGPPPSPTRSPARSPTGSPPPSSATRTATARCTGPRRSSPRTRTGRT
ncbi:hypothetical protein ACRAWF_20045 [Streptomyces sp. L7]